MEDAAVKDQSPATGRSSSKLLRYPLRSANKSKEEKAPVADPLSNTCASRRGKPPSSVSKSMGVLDLSAKDKSSAKTPRRMSIPSKSTANSATKPVGSMTPISETRARRSMKSQENIETPTSDISKSSNRRKFSAISSASYWLSHVKVSESAAKHSISLGFFKLALEAGCEPLSRMREELKSYARRHNLVELGERVKELFESYNIVENIEQLQVSETCSHVPEEGTRSSDEDAHSYSSAAETQKLKPKSLNTEAVQTSPVKESAKEKTRRGSLNRLKGSGSKNTKTSEFGDRSTQKQSQQPNKQVIKREKGNTRKGKKSVVEGGQDQPLPPTETLHENKENMDAPQMEEVISTEVQMDNLHQAC